MHTDHEPQLTPRQREVLRLIAQRSTIKEIAYELGITESAVNQRIKSLKHRLGVNSQRELAERYSRLPAARDNLPGHDEQPGSGDTCSETACRIPQLSGEAKPAEGPSWEHRLSTVSFQDVQGILRQSPWSETPELQVVPRALDGRNAGWNRALVIVMLVFGIFASVIVAIAAAFAITDVISEASSGPTATRASAPDGHGRLGDRT